MHQSRRDLKLALVVVEIWNWHEPPISWLKFPSVADNLKDNTQIGQVLAEIFGFFRLMLEKTSNMWKTQTDNSSVRLGKSLLLEMTPSMLTPDSFRIQPPRFLDAGAGRGSCLRLFYRHIITAATAVACCC